MLLELVYAKGAEFTSLLMGCFGVLCAAMWGLYALYRLFRRTGFELESLAFFLTSLCLCITASSSISTLPKQTVSVLLGLFAFVLLGLFLRDLAIAKKLRWPVAIAACALLAFNVDVYKRQGLPTIPPWAAAVSYCPSAYLMMPPFRKSAQRRWKRPPALKPCWTIPPRWYM